MKTAGASIVDCDFVFRISRGKLTGLPVSVEFFYASFQFGQYFWEFRERACYIRWVFDQFFLWVPSAMNWPEAWFLAPGKTNHEARYTFMVLLWMITKHYNRRSSRVWIVLLRFNRKFQFSISISWPGRGFFRSFEERVRDFFKILCSKIWLSVESWLSFKKLRMFHTRWSYCRDYCRYLLTQVSLNTFSIHWRIYSREGERVQLYTKDLRVGNFSELLTWSVTKHQRIRYLLRFVIMALLSVFAKTRDRSDPTYRSVSAIG